VRWLPFQLNPDLPETGIPRAEYIARKFGARGNTYERVRKIGEGLGIPFAFDKITVQPNTLNAHRLLCFGEKQGRQEQVAEVLFNAYFIEGVNLTDLDALANIAARAGLSADEAKAYLASDEDRDTVARADVEARQAGIGGVPFFIFNRAVAVSGAHDPDTLLGAIKQAMGAAGASP
jgi:predicted DsbA family dithiol-disulfide isomerase